MDNDMKGISKRGNSYRFTVSVGFDGNGKHIRKYTTFTPSPDLSEKEADELAKVEYGKFKDSVNGNQKFNPNMKFSELARIYFEDFAPNKLRVSTRYNYKIAVDTHINPVFGNKKLKEIRTADITRFLLGLNLKSSSTRKTKIVMSSILTYAVSQEVLNKNPCREAIYKPSEDDEEDNIVEKVFTIEEMKMIKNLTQEYSIFNVIIRTLFGTAIRSGECLGLRWQCVDFENKIIRINKTLVYANNVWSLGPPKTAGSKRKVAIDDNLVNLLRKHKEEQNKQKAICGKAWRQPELVFTSYTGNYYDRSLLNQQFDRFLRKNNLPDNPIHSIRHSVASLMLHMNMSMSIVAKQLGNSEQVCDKTYSHFLKETQENVAKIIAEAIG